MREKIFYYKPEPEKIPKLEILEPIKRDEVIHFDNPNDFNDYYNKNKPEFEGISTRKLNAKYIISGYIIARRSQTKGGEKILMLSKDYYGTSDKNLKKANIGEENEIDNDKSDKLEDLIQKFNILSDRFDKLLKYLLDAKVIQ